MRSSYRNVRPALLALLITTNAATMANAQDLALIAPAAHPLVGMSRPNLRSEGRSPTPITDDGNTEERVPATSQLVLTYSGEKELTFTLDILDERGDVVQHHVLEPARSQHYWAIDVRHLRNGRYVARVLCAQGAVVNRFRRD